MENIQKERMLEDRGALPSEDGDLLREYRVTHEENVLSNWLREDAEGEQEEREMLNKDAKEEESKSGKRGRGGRRGKELKLSITEAV